MAKRIVLLGPPGSGKGTQAVSLAGRFGLAHISTGDIMRAAVANQSALGMLAKGFMDRGELVPDTLVINLIRERLAQPDCTPGFVLDGFPRTLDQATALTDLLTETGMPLTHVLELKVPEDDLIARIKKRGELGSGRSDDTAETAVKRLAVYWAQTAPVSGYYAGLGQHKEVDGLGTIDEVFQRIVNEVSRGISLSAG